MLSNVYKEQLREYDYTGADAGYTSSRRRAWLVSTPYFIIYLLFSSQVIIILFIILYCMYLNYYLPAAIY
jgi:hypothetical protein